MSRSLGVFIRHNEQDVIINHIAMPALGLRAVFKFLWSQNSQKNLTRRRVNGKWEFKIPTSFCEETKEFRYGSDHDSGELPSDELSIAQIMTLFPNVESFVIRCRNITFKMVRCIFRNGLIKNLDISYSSARTAIRFRPFDQVNLNELVSLLAIGVNMQESDLQNFLIYAKNLERLDIKPSLSNSISFKCLKHLTTSLEILCIDLTGFRDPSEIFFNFEIDQILTKMRSLTLCIGEFDRFNFRVIELVMPNLEVLEIHFNSSSGKCGELPRLEKLTHVRLREGFNYTTVVLNDDNLLLWTKAWPRLTHLEITGDEKDYSGKISDCFLQYCHIYCKAIEYVRLRNLNGITDRGIFYLSLYPKLKHVEMLRIRSITARGVHELITKTNLNYLMVRDCNNISQFDLVEIQNRIINQN